ncbi:MAG: DUF4446 family protein [Anaerolineaceae bacterium]|nr:MAG: DUF4446 family protein [Anaerolineaceae bacterium]
MNLIELMEQNVIYIIFGLAVLLIVLLLMTIIIMSKQRKLNIKYRKFMQGASGKELEEIITERFTEIDSLKYNSMAIHKEITNINENLLTAVQKIGIVKYDAFMEMGGKLSFVLALLDKNNDGFILNSVHSSREGCYTYLKEIIKGESFLELSKEEKNALSRAIKSDNFME